MNFLKTNMGNPDTSSVPNAGTPRHQNAQALEEQSPTSPTFDSAVRNSSEDPSFKYDMFGTDRPEGIPDGAMAANRDRRMSKEWDASKVPPSRFQKRAGSIHATPASRDGHVDRNDRSKLFEALTNKSKGDRRKSQS